MGVTAGVIFGAGEVAADVGAAAEIAAAATAADVAAATTAADFAAMGALGDFSALTAADVALPSVVGEAAAGTLAYAPAVGETLAGVASPFMEGVGVEGAALPTGVSSTVEAGAVPTAATQTAAQQALATAPTNLAAGGGTVASTAAPIGTVPEEFLGSTPFQVGAPTEVGPLTPSGAPIIDTGVAPLTPSTAGMTPTTAEAATAAGGAAPAAGAPATSLEVTVPSQVSNAPVFTGPGAGGQLSSSLSNLGYGTAAPSDALAGSQYASLTGQTATDTTATVGGEAVKQGALTGAETTGTGAPVQVAQAAPATTAPATTAPATTAPAAAPANIYPASADTLKDIEGISKATQGLGSASESQIASAAGTAGSEGFGSSVVDYIKKNPSMLLGGAGLLYNLMGQQQQPRFQRELSAEAQQAMAQGRQLTSYMTTGNLPPGVQTSLNAAHDAAAATIRSQYAARGASGSSAEAQDLQRLSQTVVSQGASIASQLAQMGISEQQMAAGIYTNLMNANIQKDAQLSNAIAGFSNALAYGAARSVG